jgi:hypothetical protein
MSAICYRALCADDMDAVFETARVAWQFTYATIFDPGFIDQFVRPNCAPDRLRSLVSSSGLTSLDRKRAVVRW